MSDIKKVVYDKKFNNDEIEWIDPMDFLNSDDIVVDIFGTPRGTFHVVVTFEADPTFDPTDDE